MELAKHRIWDVPNLDDFKKSILEEPFIKNEVPDTIKKELKTIEKLMLHSYFEYDFIDLALVHGVFTFEKALKLRYEELGNRIKKGNNLIYFINWFFEKGFFETDSVSEIHSLRDIRNKKVHETEPHEKGLLYIKAVYDIFDLINDLYEDKELRVKRKNSLIDIQGQLSDIYKNGCIFEIEGKKYIGFQSITVFLNNKPGLNELSLNLWLIFDPKKVSFKRGYADNCKLATITNWSITNDCLIGRLKKDNSHFHMRVIDDKTNLSKFNLWFKEFSSQPNWLASWFGMTNKIGFKNELRSFYRVSK